MRCRAVDLIKRSAAGLLLLAATDISALTVVAPAGSFVGTEVQVESTAEAKQVAIFRGIPYAQPPVGELRWRAPQPLAAMTADFVASDYGNICLQPQRHNNQGYPQSEDCLNMNIWQPTALTDAADKPLPVMVWIHGGAFQFGSGRDPRSEATRLAAKGVVVVSFNYRLGVLGRFAHPALSREQAGQPLANYGLMDQVAALKWVKNNIASFGGDPNNVTIFGNSAGAVSVNYLMAAPAAKGLFHRAIAQSSAVLIPKSRHISKPVGTQKPLEDEGLALAAYFEIADNDRASKKLRALTAEQIQSIKGPRTSTNPVIDGVFIVEDLATSYRTGRIHRADYMTGVSSWEASLAQAIQPMPKPVAFSMVAGMYGFTMPALLKQYVEGHTEVEALDNMFADSFHASTLFLSQQVAANGGNSYLYSFNYLPAGVDSVPGVPHSGEIAYVFANLDQRYAIGSPALQPKDKLVSEQVQNYWLNFARKGNPNGKGLVHWPSQQAQSRSWFLLDEQPRVDETRFNQRMDFWLDNYQR